MGIGDHDRVLVSMINKNHHPVRKTYTNHLSASSNEDVISEDPAYWLEVDLDYPKPCKLKITIYDASSQNLLKRYDFIYNTVNTTFSAYIKNFKEKGIPSFRVEIVSEKTHEKRSHVIIK